MNSFIKAKRLEIFVVLIVIAVIGIAYALTQKATAPVTTSQNQNQQATVVSSVSYQGQDNRNALDLLQVFHKVDTKDTSFGKQVMGIDGVTPDPTNSYWAFYVNGKLAQVGADHYTTKYGDLIEWKVEKF